MIDVFHAIHECRDVVDYWDVTRRTDGVLVRVRSRQVHPTERAAAEVAREIADRVRPAGYRVAEVPGAPRISRHPGAGWHAFVEVFVA
jgi:hypothetical protein